MDCWPLPIGGYGCGWAAWRDLVFGEGGRPAEPELVLLPKANVWLPFIAFKNPSDMAELCLDSSSARMATGLTGLPRELAVEEVWMAVECI